jgi:hypothetical protein
MALMIPAPYSSLRVLGGVAAALGHEGAKMIHQRDAYRLLAPYPRIAHPFLEPRIGILAIVPERQEPRLVVDARDPIGHFLVRRVDPPGQHARRPLHAVAQAHVW